MTKIKEILNAGNFLQIVDLFHEVVASMQLVHMTDDFSSIYWGLTAKATFHALSLYKLSLGTRIRGLSFPVDIVDHTSMNVITRAIIESTARIHYLLLDDKCNHDEREFRISIYLIQGLMPRQPLRPSDAENAVKLVAEAIQLESLGKRLKATAKYKKLTPKQRERALAGQSDQAFEINKVDMIKNANKNLASEHAQPLYSFLSDHAHSGYLSAFQVSGTNDRDVQKRLGQSMLELSLYSLLGLIWNLAAKYPPAAYALDHGEFASKVRRTEDYQEFRRKRLIGDSSN